MPQDHDGNTLTAGDNVWIPCQIVSATTGGMTVKTSYSGTTITSTVTPSDSHKAGNFPDRP